MKELFTVIGNLTAGIFAIGLILFLCIVVGIGISRCIIRMKLNPVQRTETRYELSIEPDNTLKFKKIEEERTTYRGMEE